MRSIHDLAVTLHRIVKSLMPLSDEERVTAYIEEAGDLIDLEMRIREVHRGRLHRR